MLVEAKHNNLCWKPSNAYQETLETISFSYDAQSGYKKSLHKIQLNMQE